MRKLIIENGTKFANWTVIKEDLEGQNKNHYYYICRCDCGNVRSVDKRILVSGSSKYCKECRSKRTRKDIKEELIGDWIILERIVKNKITYYKCKCGICNDIHFVKRAQLVCGRSKRCKKCSQKHRTFEYTNDIPGSMWYRTIVGAKKRKLEFSITKEEAKNLFIKQNGICALSGIKISFQKKCKDPNLSTASLDRIDSDKGYITGNIQWVHKYINFMKSILNNEEFIMFCRKVVEYNDTK